MNNKTKDVIIVGFALFAMFLGAGNLIFPPYLGFNSGTAWPVNLLGFVLTGVGLPFLGIYSTIKSGGNVMTLGRYVGRGFSIFFGVAIILAIGPCFAIPRTAATTHEVGVMQFAPDLPPIVTSIVFFALVLFFCFNSAKVVDYIGKILTPFLMITLFTIVVLAVIKPIGSPVELTGDNVYNFAGSFTEGYQTLDALAATMFCGTALASIVSRGYNTLKDQLNLTIYCGIIAAGLLAFVYGGLLYAGASASGTMTFPEDVTRPQMLIQIVHQIFAGVATSWGPIGAGMLAIAVSLACLTTAVGLVTTCAQYFNQLSNGKLGYRLVVIVTVAFSFFVSIMGVTWIINAAVPVLFLMYPVLIVLLIFTLFDKFIPNKNAYTGGIIGAFLISIIDALNTLKGGFGFDAPWIDSLVAFKSHIPFDSLGLAWIIPVAVLAIIASFLPRKRVDEEMTQLVYFEEGTK
ncbi:branched-chain amino acid transport system II carrier protein [Peptococcus niger]|uniref:Branched-chain amino acid transport system carrier protein n=1 Tax=Peptococcus niger TaxID=2741 RepID=A0A1G6ZZ44_PEPNI|nr:branched-chain amino acid transport system II carrier protein [Peptococcus niger]SDE07105.1 branched-chain amino acid:cation transporter, LIVCS family [Peptococcus niger]